MTEIERSDEELRRMSELIMEEERDSTLRALSSIADEVEARVLKEDIAWRKKYPRKVVEVEEDKSDPWHPEGEGNDED